MLKLHDKQVPREEWQFLAMPEARRSLLEEIHFGEIATQIVKEDRLAGEPRAEVAEDRAAPPNTLRAIFPVAVLRPLVTSCTMQEMAFEVGIGWANTKATKQQGI